MTDIPTQRRRALAARRALSPSARRQASHRACIRVARLPVFRRARQIGLYWPLASETDPRPLLAQLRPGQRVYLPRVNDQHLDFIAITDTHFSARLSPLGIYEPRGAPARRVEALDLLILPLAGFDDHAHRIGLGGGYYDRTLAAYAAGTGFRRPRLVGLAFEAQRVGRIQNRPWDIALDAVVSDARVYRGRTGGPVEGDRVG
ncbi:5-formyltetrahydrofolate cyclo-ligase [Salinisphaera aquimarina]|uniref:5-formyltetrahydrofolate cyclo-ligase n=1 Tax=Salinisphaera aquimarina TaxID=2094031 RepID=A0ABV7EST6_9GAMM